MTYHYSRHVDYCMKCTSCPKRAAARMENEPVTAVTVVDLNIYWDTILMRYSWSFQQCNIVTSRFGNKQQVLRKRRMSVLGSRLCCTGTGKCFRKSEVADLWTGLLCWSLGTAMRSFRTSPMTLCARQALHALISFRNSTCPNE